MIYQPKISVLIPTYNYGHFLDEAIQSVLNQTFSDFELIVVDNNSNDQTADIVAKYLDDSRIRYYKNGRTLSLPENWNKSLEYARGEYVKILCADDKLHTQMLDRFVRLMDQHPTVSVISSSYAFFGDADYETKAPFEGLVDGEVARKSMLSRGNWLGAPTCTLFRRATMEGARFHTRLSHSIDIEFYFQLLAAGDAYVVPDVLSYIRVHHGSVTSMHAKQLNSILESYRYLRVIKEKSRNTSPSFQSLVDDELRRRAIRCSRVMYKLLPTIYRKESRKLFAEAFQIGYREDVHLTSLTRFLTLGGATNPSRKTPA